MAAPSRLDNVISLAKRRGFVFPSGEIYGGTRSAWDYGPLGVELKESVIMGRAEIGRLSFIGDSVIGQGVDLGAGIMTVNRNVDLSSVHALIRGQSMDTGLLKLGALIGDRARIGAGNTLLPGTRIPAQAMVPHRGHLPELQEGA